MEDYEEMLDEAQDEFEQQQDLQDMQYDQFEAATVPKKKVEHNLYNWFWKVVRLRKPFSLSKVGNLTTKEIGDFGISMRDALNLAFLGHTFAHPTFGNYWAMRSKVISATSMAKQGWFMDLSISQRKIRQRSKSGPLTSEKWRLFGKKRKTPTEED